MFFACQNPTAPPAPVDPITVSDEAPPELRYCSALAPIPDTRAVGSPNKYWQQNKVLRIGFISSPMPTPVQIAFVRATAEELDSILNLSFTFPASGPYDIRWVCDPTQGSWSHIGNDCANVDQSKATGCIGWGYNSKNAAGVYTEGVCRHEFLHALGAKHEACVYNSNIPWNKEAIYADMARQGWSRAQVDYNFFAICDPATHNQTAWDGFSVMQYPIKASWTTNNTAIPGGQYLTATDKAFWKAQYKIAGAPPPPVTSWTVTTTQANTLKRLNLKVKVANDVVKVANDSLINYTNFIFK